jgi:hypothetical protein
MESPILRRILAEAGIPNLLSTLAEGLPPSDLQSLLLEVFRSRARAARDSTLLAKLEASPLCAPTEVDPRLFLEFDRVAFAAAEGFKPIELSPVCPLGAQHALGAVDQNNVLTTIRNAELPGDPTPALALECARLRKDPALRAAQPPARLCASQRVVRLQPFDFPGYSPHFRLFALATAGRAAPSNGFEVHSLAGHIGFYLRLCRNLNAAGFHLADPLVEISDLAITEDLLASAGVTRAALRKAVRAHDPGSGERFLAENNVALPAEIKDPAAELAPSPRTHRLAIIKQHVFDALRAKYPEAGFRFNLARLEGLGYYDGLCLRIAPEAPGGVRYPIIDGGFTDWTARLLQDRKERLLTTGIGTEFVCRRYRA